LRLSAPGNIIIHHPLPLPANTQQASSTFITAGQFFITPTPNNNNQPIEMPTSNISTPLNGVDASVVITALHNHDLMIKTLCPALVSYAFESGDKDSSATYTVTDKKPIGRVHPPIPLPICSIFFNSADC
jgi:hypothetical protein